MECTKCCFERSRILEKRELQFHSFYSLKVYERQKKKKFIYYNAQAADRLTEPDANNTDDNTN